MKRRILGMASGLAFAMMLASPGNLLAQESDWPLIMTLKTNIYGYQGPTNSFTIYLGSTEENVEVYVESPVSQEYIDVNPWSLGQDSDGSNTAFATAISLNVSENDNEVRIYGDKTKIDYIDVHGCYMNSVELNGELPNLTVIDLSHNELTAIDLSEQTALASIDLTDNAFTDPGKMVIGTNHPGLIILQVGINEVVDPELSLPNFPNLQYFSARNNYGLNYVDPTQCPNLVSLVLEVTNVSSVDVSKNPYLDVLNLSQTRVTSVDLSNNKALGEFYINHEGSYNNLPQYKVKSIDLSNNPALQYLDLGGNALTSLDLSNNPDLRLLHLQRNQLTELDLSNKPKLAVVNLSNNLFTFATLPIPASGWDYYYYRSPLACDLKYKVGEPIDFSSSVIRAPFVDEEGSTITPQTYANVYVAPRAEYPYELDEDLYTFDQGVLTFKEAVADSVYVQFFCDIFPDWPLNTSNFMVKTAEAYDAPSAAFEFTPGACALGKEISISMGATKLAQSVAYPADVNVIYGDQKLEFKGVVDRGSLPSSANVIFTLPTTNEPITVTLPDGFSISALAIDGVEIADIDLSAGEGLNVLKLTNCGLKSIDLGYNRALTTLDLSGNDLKMVDLAGVRGDYEKFSLSNINLSHNKLTNLATVSAESIHNLDVSYNNFSNFDLKYYTGIKTINLSNNHLSGEIDFSSVEKLRGADISGNNISNIILNTGDEALEELSYLYLNDNSFSFATLPALFIPRLDYIYAPQNKYSILSKGAAINLSSQNVVVNGKGTQYVWKYAQDNAIVPESEYTNEGGGFKFSESLAGSSIYCEMTNPNFPLFDSEPLTTTDLQVANKPDVLLASFVTPASGVAQIGFRFSTPGENAVYIDWRGDGSEYEPYEYSASDSGSIYRTGTTYAGSTAKVYSYDDASNISVFAMLNTPLSSIDISPLTAVQGVLIHGAGLTDGSIVMPESPYLNELVFDGNKFSEESFSQFTNVESLNLAENEYQSFDLSPFPKVRFVQLSHNKLTDVKFGKSDIIQVDLTSNYLQSIDLSDLSSLSSLLIADNELSEINFTPEILKYLQALVISGNYFTLATLPIPENMGEYFSTYYYANQHPMEVECIDGKIDLSAQAFVGTEPTSYYWFLGDFQSDVYFDYEQEAFIGEILEGPEDSTDPEYTIKDGVTTFLYPQIRNVICAMVNAQFPNLILYTAPTGVTMAGVDSLFDTDSNGLVDVFTIGGVKVKGKVNPSEALQGLAPGVYVIGGKKILVK